jgi:cytochrome b
VSTTFESRAEALPAARTTLVWDAPTRAFHWLLAASFAGAFVTAGSERWRLAHTTLGYTVLGLVGFRLLWGVIGTRHARFAQFVRGPRVVAAYLGSLLALRPQRYAGHNPAGAVAIVALLALAAATALAGWALEAFDVHALEELHEGLANAMLAVVGVHVAGVAASSGLHRENLVAAMIDGRKRVPPAEGIRRPWLGVALLLVAAVVAFWLAR